MLQARKRQKLSLLTALVTLLTVLIIPSGGAFAADIGPIDCVTPPLQTAINSAASGDTIIIADGTTCTGNFTVNKELTIRAETAAGATLDGGGVDAGPVLSVLGGPVTLQDLTIQNGVNTSPANSGLGGGLFVDGAIVSLTNSTITTNSADEGAGIYNKSGGSVTITGSTVTNNTAVNGGGIWNDATVSINASFFTNNTASNGGGGLHNIGGTLTVTGSEITGNQAEHAGGILNNGAGDLVSSSVLLTDSTVSGNAALGNDGEPAGGGGIFNFSFGTDTVKAQLTLSGTTVSGNTSAEGGAGIRNADSTADITGGTIGTNVATGNGGGIRTSGAMTITDATISDNSATVSGGGISLDGDSSTLIIVTTALDNNTAGANGGGLDISPSTAASLTRSSVTRNDAVIGGGISNAGIHSIANSTVSSNTATSQGAGIHTSGNLTVTHATIHNNDALTGEGGGVRVIGGPTVTLTGTILFGNAGASGQDCSGALSSGGYNLVGLTSAPCVYAGDPTDLPALSDPMLGPLGLYGAATEHHPLLAGSDAIDAAGACGLSVDQNGDPRPDGAGCDVGSIEGTSPLVADDVLLVEPNGRWHIRRPGQSDYTFWYGVPGDVPIFGDWNGDGIDTPGAYRVGPGGGFAYMTNTLPPDGGAPVADFDFFFGDPSLGDEVLVGDWNGDGIDTIGVNRNGHIFLTDTNASGGAPAPTDYDFWFGIAGDSAFGGDPDGDGKDSLFLYRGSGPGAGFVYYTNQTPVGPGAVAATADNFFFGVDSDLFVSGDWNRDGVDTAGIFRPSNTTVYLTNTNASGGAAAPTDVEYVWGTAGWTPVAGVHGVT